VARAGRHQIAGVSGGKDEVLGVFKNTFELTNGSFKLDMHDLLANDTHVIAMVHAMGEREGRTLDDNSVQVFHVTTARSANSGCTPVILTRPTSSGVRANRSFRPG